MRWSGSSYIGGGRQRQSPPFLRPVVVRSIAIALLAGSLGGCAGLGLPFETASNQKMATGSIHKVSAKAESKVDQSDWETVRRAVATIAGKDANSAAQYGYIGADIVVKVLEAAGKDLTRAKFIAALESVKDYRPMFPGPTLSYGPNKHQGSNATFLAKIEGGRWKLVAENLMY